MAASAIPKKIEKTTTCRMSPRAIASMIDVGNRWRRMSQPLCCFVASAASSAAPSPIGTDSPAPGLNQFTSPRPQKRAIVVATSK